LLWWRPARGMRGIVMAWAAALATVSCNPSSSPTPEALQAVGSKALKVLVGQINTENLKYFAPLLWGSIRGPPLMMMSAATIGAASSRWIESREQKGLRDAIKILMAFTIQREAEHVARLETLESTSRQLVIYGPNTNAQWSRFEGLEEGLKAVNETVRAIKTTLDDSVRETALQWKGVAKQHTAQMEAAAQRHTEQMAAAAQHHQEHMEAAAQHHRDCLLLCYACAALCVCAILGQMYICYDTRERMKEIFHTIDKKLAPMHDTIGKVKELGPAFQKLKVKTRDFPPVSPPGALPGDENAGQRAPPLAVENAGPTTPLAPRRPLTTPG